MNNPKTSIIYGVKANGKYRYIGKTNRIPKDNTRNLPNSIVNEQYRKSKLRRIFQCCDDVCVEPIFLVTEGKWHPEKVRQVVKHAKDANLNPLWMRQGESMNPKHKIRLAESKFKPIAEYNKNGHFKQIWKSAKEVGITIFKDYDVTKIGNTSKIYSTISKNNIMGRFEHGSFWFRYDELIIMFGVIPSKINIDNLIHLESGKSKKLKNENDFDNL